VYFVRTFADVPFPAVSVALGNLMKNKFMKHRHIQAKHNEWIHVHRTPTGGRSDCSWRVYVIGGLMPAYIIMEFLPYLLVGAVGWFFLKFWSPK
jgi:hypothetical protein